MCLSSFPPTSILQGQASLQQRHGLRCRSGRCFWIFLSRSVLFAAASGVLDLPPAYLPAPNGSGGWGLWSCEQGSLPTVHLMPGVGACVSSGIHHGDLRLLTQHPVSQTFFPHLLLDSSVFAGNSWAQKQHCKTIYTETKMALASSCPIFQLVGKQWSTPPLTGRRSRSHPDADGFGVQWPQQHSTGAWEFLEELCGETAAVWLFLAWLWDKWCVGTARQDVGRSKGTKAGNWKLLLLEQQDCGTTQCWQEPN